MRYLKLYEDFNSNEVKIKDLLEDIASLDYILSDEGIKAEYFVTEKMASDAPNSYLLGTSEDISTKTDESFDGVGIYKIKIKFETDLDMVALRRRHDMLGNPIKNADTKEKDEIAQISEEYFNQLKEHLEEVYDVRVVKDKPYTTGAIKRDGDYGLALVNCVSVIVERQPDDYVYFEDEDGDINESVDDETAMKHYGIYPEDVKEMFYDLQDLDIFPETLRVFVEFKSMLGQNGNLMFDDPMSAPKMTFQHFPFIEVKVKSDGIKVPEYGRTQADRNRLHTELENIIKDERFKEVIEVANNRLEDYDWKIEKAYKDFRNDYIQIIIKKI
jgi:hypothetical protein